MDDVAARGVFVRFAPPLDDLQRGPARAIEEVVEERERQGWLLLGIRDGCVLIFERSHNRLIALIHAGHGLTRTTCPGRSEVNSASTLVIKGNV